MKPGPNGKGRPRGRSNHSQPQSYGKGRGPSRNQVYDSNGPGIRVRGNAHQVVEKYQALARDAAAIGDRILCENYFQHAEHYQRIISAVNQNASQRAVVPVEQGSENGHENHPEEPLTSEAVVEPLGGNVSPFPGPSADLGESIESANGFSGSGPVIDDVRPFEEDMSRRQPYEGRSQPAPTERSSSRKGLRNGHLGRPAPSDVSLPDAPQPFVVASASSAGSLPSHEMTPRVSLSASGEQGEALGLPSDDGKGTSDGVRKVRRRRAPRHSGGTAEENSTESVDV